MITKIRGAPLPKGSEPETRYEEFFNKPVTAALSAASDRLIFHRSRTFLPLHMG